MNTNEPEIIEGEIYEIIYQNDDNGYTVCELDVNNALVTACGHMPFIAPGEQVILTGNWVNHPDYGEQFSVSSLQRALPKEVSAILSYLASGIISGVRESTAKKIVAAFGADALTVIATEPERLSEIRGISPAKAKKISESFLIRQDAAQTVIFLQEYGVTPNLALRVYKRFGQKSVDLIKENPYILCDNVERIGFKTADRIASEMGLPKNHSGRLASGVKYALNTAALSGHTCLKYDDLINMCISILGCTAEEAEKTTIILKNEDELVFVDEFVYLPLYYNMEFTVAGRINELMCTAQVLTPDIEEDIFKFPKLNSLELSSLQKEAVVKANNGGILVITGGPGTGKTTVMKIITQIFTQHEYKIALCAPTGKAAKRLSESCGLEAKTLHRLLEVEVNDAENQRFAKNEYNPVDADVVIVDEMSMVDILLFGALLKALKRNTCLILAGDSDQLPSVGAGNVLGDILSSGKIPSVQLNEVFRQAGESRIVTNAHRINQGMMPLENDSKTDFFFMERTTEATLQTICELCTERLPKAYGFDAISDIQVLSPARKGTVGTINLNKVLQSQLNPPSREKKEKKFGDRIFRMGDKVIQTRNNYDMLWSSPDGGNDGFGIFNGDIGTILDINTKEKYMRILFDDTKIVDYDFSGIEDLDIAYALTVHKSQGSEWSAVIIPVCDFPPMLMTRNLLYTAVTRAKQLVIIAGSSKSMARMIQNNRQQLRYSGLKERLNEIIG